MAILDILSFDQQWLVAFLNIQLYCLKFNLNCCFFAILLDVNIKFLHTCFLHVVFLLFLSTTCIHLNTALTKECSFNFGHITMIGLPSTFFTASEVLSRFSRLLCWLQTALDVFAEMEKTGLLSNTKLDELYAALLELDQQLALTVHRYMQSMRCVYTHKQCKCCINMKLIKWLLFSGIIQQPETTLRPHVSMDYQVCVFKCAFAYSLTYNETVYWWLGLGFSSHRGSTTALSRHKLLRLSLRLSAAVRFRFSLTDSFSFEHTAIK